MAGDLKVLAWITESGWEACVDAVAPLEPSEVTLLHVTTVDLPGPRGRRHDEVMTRMAHLAEEAAQALLNQAQTHAIPGVGPVLYPPQTGPIPIG